MVKEKISNFSKKILDLIRKIYAFYGRNNLLFFILLTVLFTAAIYFLNIFTPLLADDYCYSFLLGAPTLTRLESIGDIMQSQYHHYFNWGGRSIAHGLTQFFLLYGKSWFNVVNTLMYITFTFLIYFHVNTYKSLNVGLYFIINVLVWFFAPAYGETVLWLVGACNYLWGTTFILAFLLPYRLYSADNSKINFNSFQTVLFAISGIIAGWTNENTAGAMIFAAILFIVYYKLMKMKIPAWSIIGIITALIGYIILVVAPGNYERAAGVSNRHNIIFQILYRGATITRDLYSNMYLILFIVAILLTLYFTFSKPSFSNKFKFVLYFITSLSGAYCMVFNPGGFPLRAWFGVISFMFIALGFLYVHLLNNKIVKRLKHCVLLFLIIPFIVSYVTAARDAKYVSDFVENRIDYILQQKALGNMELETKHFVANDKHNPRFTYDDIDWDSGFYGNIAICDYYGIKSIRATKESDYFWKRFK